VDIVNLNVFLAVIREIWIRLFDIYGVSIYVHLIDVSVIEKWVQEVAESSYLDAYGTEYYIVADPDKMKIEVGFER
jgi:hypothetical protein